MSIRQYLAQKYRGYRQFDADHVSVETLYTHAVAVNLIRKVLGKSKRRRVLDFDEFVRVVEFSIGLPNNGSL